MLKVTIRGEVFPFEPVYPLREAIEIEDQAGMSFGRYQEALVTGSARAVAVFAWAVLNRNGRDVPLADILSGTYELTTDDVTVEDEDGPRGPGKGRRSSATTSGGGSPPSPTGSATPRPRSGS
jgi:hypothetical protein